MKTKAITAPEDLNAAIRGKTRKRSGGRLLLLLLLVAALAVGWVVWQKRKAVSQAGPLYTTQQITRGNVEKVVTATGNLEPTNEITVGSELSGTTLEVYVDTNDQVTKGQPLAKLDTSKLTQQLESSRAAVTSAVAKVEQAKATVSESEASLARLRELSRISGGKMPAKADLDAAEATAERSRADLASAEAGVGEAEAQVRINESDVGKSVIKSPIDGIVLTRSLEPGQTVAASFQAPELFVIAEKLEQMKLEVAVAEADIGGVKAGQEASFTVDAWPDRTYQATVRKVAYGSAVTDNVVTYETELEVDNSDLSLRPGMTATADVKTAQAHDVLLVPVAALRFTPETAAPTGGKPPGGGGPQEGGPKRSSFVQSLIPSPGRGRRASNSGEDVTQKQKSGPARIWILQAGNLQPLPVVTGVSDGRMVEISGEGVTEGMAVITHANKGVARP